MYIYGCPLGCILQIFSPHARGASTCQIAALASQRLHVIVGSCQALTRGWSVRTPNHGSGIRIYRTILHFVVLGKYHSLCSSTSVKNIYSQFAFPLSWPPLLPTTFCGRMWNLSESVFTPENRYTLLVLEMSSSAGHPMVNPNRG